MNKADDNELETQDLFLLKRLRDDAAKLPLMHPDPKAWDKIAAAIEPQTVKVETAKRPWMWPVSIAASFVVGAMMMLVANQLWQNNQLESQIALSTQYESQLVALRLTSPWIESQLWQIAKIDQQLNQAGSVSERKALWQRRNEILQQILQQPVSMNEMI